MLPDYGGGVIDYQNGYQIYLVLILAMCINRFISNITVLHIIYGFESVFHQRHNRILIATKVQTFSTTNSTTFHKKTLET